MHHDSYHSHQHQPFGYHAGTPREYNNAQYLEQQPPHQRDSSSFSHPHQQRHLPHDDDYHHGYHGQQQQHHHQQQRRHDTDGGHQHLQHFQQRVMDSPSRPTPPYSSKVSNNYYDDDASHSNPNGSFGDGGERPRNGGRFNSQSFVDNTLSSLPIVILPPYELPPDFVPKSERRFHPDYSADLQKFRNRTVQLRRTKPSDQLGFNLRGGAEHKCGIFISKVTPRTDAQRAGLQEGDQILFANGESFLHIERTEAVKSLKRQLDVELVVKYFPYAYDKSYEKCKSSPST